MVKKQIKFLIQQKIQKLIIKINDLEKIVKKIPTISTNILTNFILEE